MASCHAIQSLSNFTFRIWTSSAAPSEYSLARQRRLPSRFGGEFGARLREFKRGHAASRWAGRAAGNGVNGSLILSRSGGGAECLMDVFSLRALSLLSVPFKTTIKTKTLKCIEKASAAYRTTHACVSLAFGSSQLLQGSVDLRQETEK